MIKESVIALLIGTFLVLQASVLYAAVSKSTAKSLTVVGFVGKAEIMTSKNKWKTLNIEDKVTENNEIRILKKYDYLELALEDGVYRVTGKTTLKVADLFKKINSSKKRVLNIADNYKVETTTAPAAVRGGAGKPGRNLNQNGLPPELTFVVTGPYKGTCQYKTDGADWQNISYGLRLPKEAEIKIIDAGGSLRLNFFDKSSTNINGPAEVKISDVLESKLKSMR